MAEITAGLVKELREKTGAGMMDCKKALVASDGDLNAAIDNLRKSGAAKAAKKAGRETTEGRVQSKIVDGVAVAVEVLCETDFVAKNDEFEKYLNQLCDAMIADRTDNGDISEAVQESERENLVGLIAKVGENVQIRRAVRWQGDANYGTYLHMGGKIGVLVECEGNSSNGEFLTDVCMHIAAFNPLYVSPDAVPDAVTAKEKEIAAAQPELAGKPPEILEKILTGKMKKWYAENCLVKQPWIRDDKATIEKVAPDITIRRFARWQVGEDI